MAKSESPSKGDNQADEDLKTKPVKYTGGKPEDEAEERSERRFGGEAKDHKDKTQEKRDDKKEDRKKRERKHGGKTVEMHGDRTAHMGRKPRKSGGRTGSDTNPFTSARHGTPAKGRTMERLTED